MLSTMIFGAVTGSVIVAAFMRDFAIPLIPYLATLLVLVGCGWALNVAGW